MSNIDQSLVDQITELQKKIYDKVKDTVVTYDKSLNQDVYESVMKLFGPTAPSNVITLDMVITCLGIVKRAAADKAESTLGRF